MASIDSVATPARANATSDVIPQSSSTRLPGWWSAAGTPATGRPAPAVFPSPEIAPARSQPYPFHGQVAYPGCAMKTLLQSRQRLTVAVALLVAVASVAFAVPTAIGQQSVPSLNPFEHDTRFLCPGRAEPRGTSAFLRTELYFGSNKPDGTAVTPEEFQQFLDAEITKRFPDGLTLLTGLGQFKGSSGVVERERSMLLILLYPVDSARSSGQKIEEIRTLYEDRFHQESVLRADEPLPECVSF